MAFDNCNFSVLDCAVKYIYDSPISNGRIQLKSHMPECSQGCREVVRAQAKNFYGLLNNNGAAKILSTKSERVAQLQSDMSLA